MSPMLRRGWDRTSFRGRVLLIAAGTLLFDVATKVLGVALLDGSSSGPGWLRLHVVRNSGIAFGIGSGSRNRVILAVTVIVVAVLMAAVWRGWLTPPVAVGLILGGAIANVLDRAVDGTVVDLIDLGWWPAFNLADAAIVLGVALLVVRRGSMGAKPLEVRANSQSSVSKEA